jgi:hypothetical protein
MRTAEMLQDFLNTHLIECAGSFKAFWTKMLVRSVMTITAVFWRCDPDHRVMCRRSHRADVELRCFAVRRLIEGRHKQITGVSHLRATTKLT